MQILLWITILQAIKGKTTLLPKQDTVHKSSGLIFQYLSEYKPANNIMTFTVSIPVVKDMCYLLPMNAIKKIHQCNARRTPSDTVEKKRQETENRRKRRTADSISNRREKRFITDIISIGIGTAATALATANTIQLSNLQREVKSLKTSLETIEKNVDITNSLIMQVSTDQIKIAEELQHTQMALNNTIALINEHSNALKQNKIEINTLSTMILLLKDKLTSFIHSVETHFIHDSIEDIMSNKLNLRFIHQQDLPRVIEMIMGETNILIEQSNNPIPEIELINQLLVQQQVEFIPPSRHQENKKEIIGNLLFISFFAYPKRDQPTFSIYQLTAIPFNQGDQRVKIAQLPSTIGISKEKHELIAWTKEESNICQFKLMSSCRETPPIRTEWQHTCIFEIITDKRLTRCQVENDPETTFVKRIGQQWIISTENTTRCHSVTHSDPEQHVLTSNTEMILPPIAILTIQNSTSLSCDKFFLPGLATDKNRSISIIENEEINIIDGQIVNLHQSIMNDTHWKKIPYIPSNIENIIEHLKKSMTSTIIPAHNPKTWWERMTPTITVVLVVTTIILGILYLYITIKGNRKNTPEMIIMPRL